MQLLDCCYTNGGDGEHAFRIERTQHGQEERRYQRIQSRKKQTRKRLKHSVKEATMMMLSDWFISSLQQQLWQP